MRLVRRHRYTSASGVGTYSNSEASTLALTYTARTCFALLPGIGEIPASCFVRSAARHNTRLLLDRGRQPLQGDQRVLANLRPHRFKIDLIIDRNRLRNRFAYLKRDFLRIATTTMPLIFSIEPVLATPIESTLIWLRCYVFIVSGSGGVVSSLLLS